MQPAAMNHETSGNYYIVMNRGNLINRLAANITIDVDLMITQKDRAPIKVLHNTYFEFSLMIALPNTAVPRVAML